MKFEKAIVNRISMEEEDVIVTSGCSDAAAKIADRCVSETYEGYSDCASNALWEHNS